MKNSRYEKNGELGWGGGSFEKEDQKTSENHVRTHRLPPGASNVIKLAVAVREKEADADCKIIERSDRSLSVLLVISATFEDEFRTLCNAFLKTLS